MVIIKSIRDKNYLKKGLVFALCIAVISVSTFSLKLNDNFQTKLQESEFNKFPRISGSVSLKYGYYLSVHAYASNRIEWSFSSSKSYIGIKVLVMDSGNFYKYQNNILPYTYKTESDGSLSEDSGSYLVTNGDQWYVVFLNIDSNHETTTLTYTVKFDPSNLSSSDGFLVMIGGIAAGSVIGLTVTVILIRKRRKGKINRGVF